MDGPALHAPPLSYDHSTAPVFALRAYIVPRAGSRLQPKITPLAPLTAASARLPAGSAVVHNTAPVFALRASQPPEWVTVPSLSVQGSAPTPPPLFGGPLLAAATYIDLPSVADPHCSPPVTPP